MSCSHRLLPFRRKPKNAMTLWSNIILTRSISLFWKRLINICLPHFEQRPLFSKLPYTHLKRCKTNAPAMRAGAFVLAYSRLPAFQKTSCCRLRTGSQLLRRPRKHGPSSVHPAAGPQLNDPVRRSDHLLIVLHCNHRSAAFHHTVQQREKVLNVKRMQAYGRLIH